MHTNTGVSATLEHPQDGDWGWSREKGLTACIVFSLVCCDWHIVCQAETQQLNLFPGDILRLPISSFYCENKLVQGYHYDKCIFIVQSNVTTNYTFSIVDIDFNSEYSELSFGQGDVVNSQSRLFDATRSNPMNWFAVVKTKVWLVYHRVCLWSGEIELNLTIEATTTGMFLNKN